MIGRDALYSKILGSLVGGAIGDAFGGPVEMAGPDRLTKMAGKPWVDELLPYASDHGTHPLGVWETGPPRGTGTDDLRNNQILVECVIRNGRAVNSQLLAIEYIERYRDRASFYPRHVELAERFLRGRYLRSCAYLGMRTLPDGSDGRAVAAAGNAFPSLSGLISLAPAGLLYADKPEAAYRRAFELSFLDVGYARDATAMMAAMVSAALGGGRSARAAVEIGLGTDPFGYGDRRIVGQRIRRFLEIAGEARDDQDLIRRLSPEVTHLHLYDPIDVLGVPVATLCFCDGDPGRAIAMAANDRDLTEGGELRKLRDADCTGGVAGALAGALRGVQAFPDDWVSAAIDANRRVYGIDLEANAKGFMDAVYGEGN